MKCFKSIPVVLASLSACGKSKDSDGADASVTIKGGRGASGGM